jgi:hypothetical protein
VSYPGFDAFSHDLSSFLGPPSSVLRPPPSVLRPPCSIPGHTDLHRTTQRERAGSHPANTMYDPACPSLALTRTPAVHSQPRPASAASASTAATGGGGAATAPGASPPAGSFLQPLLPSPTPDLLAQLEGRAPIFQPGVAWALRNRDRQLFYPAWMRGEWEVSARFAAASFPQGRRLLGRTVPGVLKGSMVVALPDVGAAMDAPVLYRVRFVDSPREGGVVADR